MNQSFIIHVTESDFDYEVIQYSQKTPVVVDFWAEWCIPCKSLDPILTQLVEKRGGDVRLAKVDVDANQKLAQRFNVRSIPAVKGFREGQVISEFSGVLPEPQIQKFLDELAPSPSDLNLSKGESLLTMEEWQRAKEAFEQVLEERPRQPRALLGMVKCLLTDGQGTAALTILDDFPASREFSPAQQMRPLAIALHRVENNEQSTDEAIDAMYNRALFLIGRGNLPAAMDGLLAVLREDKRYRNGEAREVMIGLFEILGNENPITRQYRTELASVLY
jgi:putative thioredoxin